MKKNIGNALALYPTPLVVVGGDWSMESQIGFWWDILELWGMIISWSVWQRLIIPIRG